MTKRITESAEIASFRKASDDFCRVVATVSSQPLRQSCTTLFAIVHLLSYRALYLPDITSSDAFDKPFSHASWKRLYDNLRAHFGRHNVYWQVFDPYDHEHVEAINGTLADDLSGIYGDIQPGLRAWANASAAERRSIVWQWRFQYAFHWGHHATSAMRALHSLVFGHDAGGEDDDVKELHPTKPSNATSEPAPGAGSEAVQG